jgi:hypothetical protein
LPETEQNLQSSKTWCVANPAASEDALRANLEFACSESDCAAIQGTGGCSFPDDDGSLPTRASVAMNAYYQARGRNSWNCFFNGTGLITITDPSKYWPLHSFTCCFFYLNPANLHGFLANLCRFWQLQVCLS